MLTLHEISGDCGAVSSMMITVNKGGQSSGECSGSNVWSDDFCDVQADGTILRLTLSKFK